MRGVVVRHLFGSEQERFVELFLELVSAAIGRQVPDRQPSRRHKKKRIFELLHFLFFGSASLVHFAFAEALRALGVRLDHALARQVEVAASGIGSIRPW